jgi:hypothetical protein
MSWGNTSAQLGEQLSNRSSRSFTIAMPRKKRGLVGWVNLGRAPPAVVGGQGWCQRGRSGMTVKYLGDGDWSSTGHLALTNQVAQAQRGFAH